MPSAASPDTPDFILPNATARTRTEPRKIAEPATECHHVLPAHLEVWRQWLADTPHKRQ